MKADLKGWQDFCADPRAAAKLTWDLYHTQTQAVLKSEEASSTVSVPLIDGGDAAVHGLLWVDSKAFTEVYELYRTAGIITAPWTSLTSSRKSSLSRPATRRRTGGGDPSMTARPGVPMEAPPGAGRQLARRRRRRLSGR